MVNNLKIFFIGILLLASVLFPEKANAQRDSCVTTDYCCDSANPNSCGWALLYNTQNAYLCQNQVPPICGGLNFSAFCPEAQTVTRYNCQRISSGAIKSTPPYSCQIDVNKEPITASSFTGRITEDSRASNLYDQTEWLIVESTPGGGIPSINQAIVVATNNQLSYTFTNLQPGKEYYFFARRKNSRGNPAPQDCLDGQGNGVVKTLNNASTTLTPRANPSGQKQPVYAKYSPYLTPYNPGITNIIKQAAIVAAVMFAVYLIF